MKANNKEVTILFILSFGLTFYILINGILLLDGWFSASLKSTQIEGFNNTVTFLVDAINKEEVDVEDQDQDEQLMLYEQLVEELGLELSKNDMTVYTTRGFLLADGEVTDNGYFVYSYQGEWYQPIKSGRYPTKEEVSSGKKICLINENTKRYTYKKEMKEWIDIESVPYEVVGILEKDTIQDEKTAICIFYSQNNAHTLSINKYNLSQRLYAGMEIPFVIGNKISSVEEEYIKLKDKIESDNYFQVQPISSKELSKRIVSFYQKIRWMIVMVLFFVSMLNCYMTVKLWAKQKLREMIIMKTFGMSNIKVIAKIGLELSRIVGVIFVVSFGIFTVFLLINMHRYEMIITLGRGMIVILIGYLLVILGTMIPIIRICVDIHPAEGLRRL